jgi:hypothetical protein
MMAAPIQQTVLKAGPIQFRVSRDAGPIGDNCSPLL